MNLYEKFEISDNSIKFKISKQLKERYVDNDFWVKYGKTEINNAEECLNIPLILNIAPVIWATNLKVSVPIIDRQLYDSLKDLKIILKKMYPSLEWGGDINATNIAEPEKNIKKKYSMLFSGGVDSLNTLLTHLEKKPILISIRGADIKLDDDVGWNNVKDNTLKLSDKYNLETIFIESNLYGFLNQSKLNEICKSIPGWWGGVQHSMGFMGLIAPFSENYSIKNCFIASTHSVGYQKPWGSTPDLDNKISFLNFRANHDAYEFNRFEKIQNIVKFNKKNKNDIFLRVCYKNNENAGRNCCKCEKCIRTIIALCAQSENPKNFGFDIKEQDIERNVNVMLNNKNHLFDDNLLFQWTTIQKNIQSKDFYLGKNISNEIINTLLKIKSINFYSYRKDTEIKRKKRLNILSKFKNSALIMFFARFIPKSVKERLISFLSSF